MLVLHRVNFFGNTHLDKLFAIIHVSLIWYFFQKSIFWKKGVIINNISLSYEYYLVRVVLSSVKISSLYHWERPIKPGRLYIRNIKLFNFFFKSKKLSLFYIIIFLSNFKFNTLYYNYSLLLYPYLFLTRGILFFIFNNNFYFKIHNY